MEKNMIKLRLSTPGKTFDVDVKYSQFPAGEEYVKIVSNINDIKLCRKLLELSKPSQGA